MAGEIITPTCEVTGVPLPILPAGPRENGALFIPGKEQFLKRADDFNHAWHPAPKLKKMGIDGEALHNSRVQLMNWMSHHLGYHPLYAGPEIPTDESQIFRLIVLSAAGVVPRQAIDVSKGEHTIVDLTDSQHMKISKRISIAQSKPLSKYFADFATRQNVHDVVKETEIEEFLDLRTSSIRKNEIARTMLSGALDIPIENLGLPDEHEQLKKLGFFALFKPDTPSKPNTPRWVAKKFVRQSHIDYFSDLISERLSTA